MRFNSKFVEVNSVFLYIAYVLIMFMCLYRIPNGYGDFLFVSEITIIVICVFINRNRPLYISQLSILYLSVIVYKLVITLFSFHESALKIGNITVILYKEFFMLIMLLIVTNNIPTRKLIIMIRNFGAFSAILGVFETVTHRSLFINYILNNRLIFGAALIGTEEARVRIFFFHPIICAVVLTVAWCCFLFIPFNRQYMNCIIGISFTLSIIGTKSRSSWISCFAITMIFYLLHVQHSKKVVKKRTVVLLIVIFFVFLILFISMRERINSFMLSLVSRWIDGLDNNNAANYQRVEMIKIGLSDWRNTGIINKIFGRGSGYAYQLLQKNAIRGWTQAVDNQFITLLLDCGLIGTGLYGGMLVCSIYNIVKSKRVSQESLCISMAFLSFLISSFFYEVFSWEICTFLFGSLCCKYFNPVNKKEK